MSSKNLIWVEKYRPKNLDQFVGSTLIKKKFQEYIKQGSIDHLLFSGPAGIGKTTMAKLLANNIECDSLYINTSDERSIDTLRTKIKDFAMSLGESGLKICICDEFDGSGIFLQQALRPVMEETAVQTRFILTCNYPHKIIDPIKSRCQLFEFKGFTQEQVEERLKFILDRENIKYNEEDIKYISLSTYPDLRKAINTCQRYVVDNELKFDKEQEGSDINLKVLELLKQKNWQDIRKLVNNEPIIYDDLYKLLFDQLEDPSTLITIAEHNYRNGMGADPEINFISCILKIVEG